MRILGVLLMAGVTLTSAQKQVQAPAAAPTPPTRNVGTMSELMVTVIRPASGALFYIETRTPADSDGWTALEGQAPWWPSPRIC